jgi:hypothetical protein
MDKSEEEYLLELWERNICPYCGKSIPEGTRVGRGKKRLGGFCSLGCVAQYNEFEFTQRAQHLAEVYRRHMDS